ncbi:GNAT family N-acetyltransferase [Helicobacter sp. MIT 21-1697]|uniref:GNAT family N-acetyltransferase n=1 Tax=Helicobacter sp. MIT 21-1697 TaxID=2993733 RepID=UPI00224B6E13|nr:GNAT family N-acetyltransferase [Helicobacter sp. MIT 21-1697]MCX2717893.1 GNAT family N-acetyltransferase [Helicobacter sp. MIT 21-1697]
MFLWWQWYGTKWIWLCGACTMIYLKPYTLAHKTLWNAFNADSKNGLFLFDRDYMDYHSDRFKDNSLLFYEEDKLLALLPLNITDNVLYSHQGLTFGGFITGRTMKQEKMLECFTLLRTFMQEQGISKLIYKAIPYIYHKIPSQEDLYALFVNNAQLFRVDCSSSIALPHPIALPKGRKSQITRAKRENVQINQSQDFAAFVTLLNEVLQSRHQSKAVHSAEELALLSKRFPEQIKLFVAHQAQTLLAGALVFVYPHLIHTQYLAVNDKGREIGALDLLLKTLIDTYAQSKTYFDFGISTESNGTFLNTGLISQKEGFGGRTITHQFYELLSSGGGGIIPYLLFPFLLFYSFISLLFYCGIANATTMRRG